MAKLTKSAVFAGTALSVVLGWLAVSCVRPPVFPDEPYLEFRQNILTFQHTGTGDSIPTLQVEFYFQDGDGDIGRTGEDETPPYTGDSCHNLHFALYELTDGSIGNGSNLDFENLRKVYLPDSVGNLYPIEYAYHLHYIEPVNANGNLRGTIRWTIDDFSITAAMLKGRIVCYSIYLYDRALHKSNVIFTDPIAL